ncbi:MAG TPA: aminodeoxychorismate synthase component I [Ramlibacter sp.]|nr:aminodeoxychorismate synthase component I [Ramlibacter sp.]
MVFPHAVIDFRADDDLPALRLAFDGPIRELFAWSPREVRAVLAEVDAAARSGLWCVGYLRYEAAAAFEPRAALHPADGPLAYFSLHDRQAAFPDLRLEHAGDLRWRSATDRAGFDAAMAKIHAAIAQGEIYQVNYTTELAADYQDDAFPLFCALQRAQGQSNAAYLANREETVLSVSPELFFDWHQGTLHCRPMKGTAARGATPELDERNARQLQRSAKERAENVMIVDLIRNDLSRVAQLGSVRVPSLFECRPWPTVWQMTSTVVARSRPQATLPDVFEALFPCGSVTGAPKLRAMHWIRELEPRPRGVYCGAVGVVQPGGAARFNVPIRTVVLRDGRASCGVGSGITADATAEGEWAEWTNKAQFLQQASRAFRLLQTIRREDGQWRHLELHLDRLAQAALQFGFAFERQAVRAALEDAASGRASGRVRVTVDVRGAVEVQIAELPRPPGQPLPVALAPGPVSAPAAFLRHKTTRREHYEGLPADTAAAFDTLAWNAHGEVTEFTRGNVIVERADGQRVTPPLHCGLLDGVGRAQALATGAAREAVVRVEDLASARALWFVNALRGWLPVYLN